MHCVAIGIFSLIAINLTAAGDANQTGDAEKFLTASEPPNVQDDESVTASSDDEWVPQLRIPISSRFSLHNIHRQMASWAKQIQEFIKGIDCRSNEHWFTSLGRCESVQLTPNDEMVLYLTPPRRNVVYSAILPDGDLQDHDRHHAIAVVDPFQEANFGHLVLVFYIDGSTQLWCERKHHHYLGSGLCLIQARKSRCRNLGYVASRSRFIAQKCEVNFIPLVIQHTNDDTAQGRKQQLECQSGLSGFGPCPEKLTAPSNINENCELRENTKMCYMKNDEVPVAVTPCRLYQICDYGLMIFGGWNHIAMRARHAENLRLIFKMLRRNGFRKENIQLFYNGNGNLELGEHYRHGLPASDKSAIRNHINILCTNEMCVDSLTIYVNGPAMSDGSLLLWDKNGDGLADDSETYTTRQLLTDIAGCTANQVVLMVDQSYSGVFVNELRSLKESTGQLDNVILVVNGEFSEYSWAQDVTAHWGSLSHLRSISWSTDGLGFVRSTASIANRKLAEKYTLYGAPVKRGLPENANNYDTLKENYMGCQNLPSTRWLLRFSKNSDSRRKTRQ